MADKLKVLVVDDEPDVCEMVAEVLSDHDVEEACSYQAAKEKLSSNTYDVVILDIMGVKGHELLDLYGQQFPCIMLTAHALNSDSLKKSVNGHARLFLPKEEVANLDEYVGQVLKTKGSMWPWLLRKLDFRKWFGLDFSGDDFLADFSDEDLSEDLAHGRD